MSLTYQEKQEKAFRRLEAMATAAHGKNPKRRKISKEEAPGVVVDPVALAARVEELEKECAAAKKEVQEKQRYINYLKGRLTVWEECVDHHFHPEQPMAHLGYRKCRCEFCNRDLPEHIEDGSGCGGCKKGGRLCCGNDRFLDGPNGIKIFLNDDSDSDDDETMCLCLNNEEADKEWNRQNYET